MSNGTDFRAPTPPPGDPDGLPARDAAEIAAARLQLLQHARRDIAIRLPRLERDLYAGAEEWIELRRIAAAGRGAQIRLLLHDPAAAQRDDHRLIALVQRLPSVLLVRMPVEEIDLAAPASYLLTDTGGYLYQPDASRPVGRAALVDRASRRPLEQHFNEVWDRSVRASMLQPLDL